MTTTGTTRAYLSAAFSLMAAFGALQSRAQATTGPLDTFVNNAANGATQGQIQAAKAIQATCAALGPGNRAKTLTGQQQDLFNRCNEMVASANQLNLPGAIPPVNLLRTLNLPANTLLGTIQQISGVQITSQGTLATQVPSGQFTNIGARLSALRFGGASGAARGALTSDNLSPFGGGASIPVADSYHFADDRGLGQFKQDGGEATFLRTALTDPESPRSVTSQSMGASSPWGWFTEGSYGFGSRRQTSNEDGFSFDSVSVTAGVDYNFGSAVLGGSVGYDRYKANFDTGAVSSPGGDSTIHGVSGSLFGAWFGQQWSLNGIASFGRLGSDLTRVVNYAAANSVCTPACGATRSLSGSPDGQYGAAGTTLTYDMTAASWTISPSVSMNYRRVKIDGYTEGDSSAAGGAGGLALTYDSQTIESLRSVVGFNISRPFSQSFGILTPSFKAEWDHEFKNDARSVGMNYAIESELRQLDPAATRCISCFAVPTDKPEADFGIVGAGLSAVFARRLQTYLFYERLVGVPYLKSNAVSVGVRGQF